MKKEFLTSKFAKFSSVIAATLLALGSAGAGIGIASAATTGTTSASAALTPGSLSFDSEPTIEFGGTNTISTKPATYTSSSVSDLGVSNPGNMSGWNVTVADTDFTNGTNTLAGATLSLKDTDAADISSSTGATAADYPTPVVGSDAVSITATPAEILTSPAATDADPIGVGDFTMNFGDGDASLGVPQETVLPGTYTSTLTWTLGSTPSTASTSAGTSTTPAA